MSTQDWPPIGPTTLTTIVPSYLYKEYSDDDDLQAFVTAYNGFAQAYVTWFVTILLPIYTNPNVNTNLLDWVAAGLYGILRPLLPSTTITQDVGAINTFIINTLVINGFKKIGPSTYYSVNDDIFRRIMTWHLEKGDGKLFDIRWLKRRVMRFLTGTNGGLGQTDETYPVSVTFGPDGVVNINLQTVHFAGGGVGNIINGCAVNAFAINAMSGFETFTTPAVPFAETLKEAIFAGVLELPFQFTFTVNT